MILLHHFQTGGQVSGKGLDVGGVVRIIHGVPHKIIGCIVHDDNNVYFIKIHGGVQGMNLRNL